MSKFNNTKSNKPNAVTYEDGVAYVKDPAEAWLNFMFSSYLQDQYYESAEEQQIRFISLTEQVGEKYGWEFVAKTALFSREELGLRSVSELTAAILNNKQFNNKRAFFRNYFQRPDGVGEVFAAIGMLGEKRSHALIRGAGDYLSSLGAYAIGKYKMNRKDYNMYDLINICHANSPVIDMYKRDVLENPDTWEVAISGAENQEQKEAEWKRLVEQHQLGYIALIRNLNNILVCSNIDSIWIQDILIPQLTNKKAIRKSNIYPYQIYNAYKNLQVHNLDILMALEKAFRMAIANMPEPSGHSLVILDVSGSMEDSISPKSTITLKEVGAVYAAILYISGKCDFIKFGTNAKRWDCPKLNSVFNIIEEFADNSECGWSTQIRSAYHLINKKYDRIFLISDMQIMDRCGWSDSDAGKTCYQNYCRRYGDTPIYSFDLGNYHTQTDNPNNPNVHLCTALNDTVFKMLDLLESGRDFVSYINDTYTYV